MACFSDRLRGASAPNDAHFAETPDEAFEVERLGLADRRPDGSEGQPTSSARCVV
jgi:hypothetical protein